MAFMQIVINFVFSTFKSICYWILNIVKHCFLYKIFMGESFGQFCSFFSFKPFIVFIMIFSEHFSRACTYNSKSLDNGKLFLFQSFLYGRALKFHRFANGVIARSELLK